MHEQRVVEQGVLGSDGEGRRAHVLQVGVERRNIRNPAVRYDEQEGILRASRGGKRARSLRLGLLDRVFREDFLDPLERLLRPRFRRHSALHDVRPTGPRLPAGLAVGSAGHAPRTRDSARGLTG